MNSHGYIYHQGRLKDMVIRGGENIVNYFFEIIYHIKFDLRIQFEKVSERN